MKRLLLSVLVIITISQYFWREWSQQPEVVTEYDPVAQADYTIEALSRRQFDENGHLHTQLDAEQLEHYQDLQFTYFQQPKYILYSSAQQQHWLIQANESVIYDNRNLELEGDVQVIASHPDEWFNTLYVEQLNMDLQAQTISTSSAVNAVADKLKFSGQGLRGNLQTQEFELINHVRAEYLVKN
ncbi:LPS export ABC transporter periplasmic protein LptC [Catenovulum sediminis]|uniref:Lipopolysaccharide export system protein LptC n=1 Tax=Catenovulum sediminis TaxID=1740262 RepID=A0ABV1RK51_9ALTE|nr:LPS export ABC transporter periplasmic protein LptC [Catenovulum sediminis]